MTTVMIILVWLTLFLGITFVLVSFLTRSYGDSSALYKLYAVRDALIHAVVFENVDRDDSFFDALYKNVNDLLSGSKIISGATAWPFAVEAGKYLAGRDKPQIEDEPLIPRDSQPPPQLIPVVKDLHDALNYMLEHHFGFVLLFSAKAREQRRLQRKQAKRLRDMLEKCERCMSM